MLSNPPKSRDLYSTFGTGDSMSSPVLPVAPERLASQMESDNLDSRRHRVQFRATRAGYDCIYNLNKLTSLDKRSVELDCK